MPYAISKGLALALATAPLFVACGGGNADNPGPINTPQCSGASCGTQGAPAVGAGAGPLCPANADIVTSTYLGGAGSGERRLEIGDVGPDHVVAGIEEGADADRGRRPRAGGGRLAR